MTDRLVLDETFASMFTNAAYSEYLFYAHIIAQCSIKVEEKLPAPAGVRFVRDHFELLINVEMFKEFPMNQRIGVLKHEVLHVIYGHCGSRFEATDRKIANYAMDCAINQQIKRQDLPEGCIYPEVLSEQLSKMAQTKVEVPNGLSSEEYYNIIMAHLPPSEDLSMEDIDEHSHFEDGDEYAQEYVKQVAKNMIEKSAQATLASAGRLPSEYSSLIDLLSPKQSQIKWQKLFQNVSSNTKKDSRSTFMRKSRRFGQRSDVKGKLSNRTFEWLTIVDVSGSVDNNGLEKCLSEVVLLCKKMDIESNMIQVDTQPYPSTVLSSKLKSFERNACGGTEMYPAIEQASKEKLPYDAVLVLTDGGLFNEDIEKFKSLKKPVIFIVTNQYDEPLERFQGGNLKAARLVL